mmetsp:Transcript_1206/g.3351  ORF Transcript_1206/g.3351 Transcript_1206/m.3351 type:complete len:104 (-) Transcript_1206:155-466(-)
MHRSSGIGSRGVWFNTCALLWAGAPVPTVCLLPGSEGLRDDVVALRRSRKSDSHGRRASNARTRQRPSHNAQMPVRHCDLVLRAALGGALLLNAMATSLEVLR